MRRSDKATRMGCASCPVSGCQASDSQNGGSLRGWRLTLSAVVFFLVPVVFGVAGAACARGSGGGELVGAIIGIAVGMAGSALLVRALHGEQREGA
jgi:hypothetical protein